MSAKTNTTSKVVPAQLDFLAIYNPSLGTTDETFEDQIVYFSTASTRGKANRSRRSTSGKTNEISHDERNEQLRQIGLAQGMVEFGKSFSNGKSVDTIETEQSRIILHELEAGWWILASISLTKLPIASKNTQPANSNKDATSAATEYSSREVKPAVLLLQDLLRAHATFLLHHASSMSALFVRTRRSNFIRILGRYWDSYTGAWNVLLHGNPAVNIYRGIKLAASGELGMGVGEEDRGSGEREVLEGFVGRTEGLIDVVVSRFGDSKPSEETESSSKQVSVQAGMKPELPWLGAGAEPAVEDGAVFLGVGALSRKSLRDLTSWMEDLYTWGSRAYGVHDNPSSLRQLRKKRKEIAVPVQILSASVQDDSRTLPRRPVSVLKSQDPPQSPDDQNSQKRLSRKESVEPVTTEGSMRLQSEETRPKILRGTSSMSAESAKSRDSLKGTRTDKFVNFFKLGYGTHWSLGTSSTSEKATDDESADQPQKKAGIPGKVTDLVPQEVEMSLEDPNQDSVQQPAQHQVSDCDGHFLVGLLGSLENEVEDQILNGGSADSGPENESNKRILVRTVTVELEREQDARPEANISIDFGHDDSRAMSSTIGSSQPSQQTDHSAGSGSYDGQDRNKTKKLRIIVYVKRPFIYAFLFELRAESLAFASLYKSMHHQLGPLQRPLLSSTQNVLLRPEVMSTSGDHSSAPIYDLLWYPEMLTVTSTIPNIPEPLPRDPNDRGWSRIEALSTHTQILSTYASTRKDRFELEKTSKTSRGWWVVWARILDQEPARSRPTPTPLKEGLEPIPSGQVPTFRKDDSFDSTTTMKDSTINSSAMQSLQPDSMLSGPAHPFMDIPSENEWIPKDKEIILIRKSSDHITGKSASMIGAGANYIGMGEGWGSTPAKLAQGIGVDTKRYIEGLLNMAR